jgi:predicted nucleic acid-binding Zn ribbon protein
MKRNYKLKSIKSILESFVEQDNLAEGIFNVKIKEAWEKAVEKKIFDYTKEIYIKGDVLFIKVSNPPLKQEILYSRQKVINLINEDLGKELIKKIVLK